MSSPFHILVIGYVWPESKSSAAGQNMLGLLTYFRQQNWQVTFASAAAHSIHADNLEELGITSLDIQLNCDSFQHMVAQLSPDVVVFDRFMIEEQFSWRVREACPNAVHVLNTEDLHCLREARHTAVKQGHDSQTANYNTPLAHREIAAILRSDCSLVISAKEMALLQQNFQIPVTQLCYLPLLQPEHNTHTTNPVSWQQRQHFVTIGNFRHAPNWDAVLSLKQHIWPAIRQALPEAELHVYGAYPPPKATQLNSPKNGFLVKGWADSAYEVMQNARVCLAPLRFGAGIKGKLLVAMATHTPSVTTTIGVEGLEHCKPWPGAIADLHQDFIAEAIKLYTQKAHWQQASQVIPHYLALNKIQRNNQKEALKTHLLGLSQGLTAHRQQHFLSAMLWHHSLKSSQYMSQWIEAKNKLPQ
jgi:hypothetical protein